jgi:long-chain acyl-CoA synthetase
VIKKRYGLSSMRFVASTGSPCPAEVKRAMIDWWGPVFYESYASSETGYITVISSQESLRKPGSAGRAFGGALLKIVDSDGRELPAGEVGLIYARQPAYPDFTYNNNPEARRAIERDGYPAEIEAVLAAMPGVRDCAVFGIPDAEFGEALAAAIQPEPGATLDAEAVRRFLGGRIAGYKVPRVIAFHADLPREESGKIFKRRLRAPYWEKSGRRI